MAGPRRVFVQGGNLGFLLGNLLPDQRESSGVFFSPPSPLRGRTPLTPLFEGGMQKSPVSTVLDLCRLDTRPLWGRRWGTPADFRQSEPSPPSPANPPGPALSSIARRFARAAHQPSPANPPGPAMARRAQRWPAERSDGPPSAAMARRAQQRRKPPCRQKLSRYSGLPFPQRGKGWG